MKALVDAFNQEEVLIGAFSAIVKLQSSRMFVEALTARPPTWYVCVCGAVVRSSVAAQLRSGPGDLPPLAVVPPWSVVTGSSIVQQPPAAQVSH